jgi:hypothetical protein
LGRSAPPQVVGARRPMPSWPTAVCPCGPSGSASPHGRLRRGPGGPVLFSAVPPPGGLSHSALAPYSGSPPRPLLTACRPPSRGGAGPAVLLPALLRWACGGHLGCSVCVACHVVRFVFGGSLGPFPGAAQPYSYCRCLPLGSRPGLGLFLCAHARGCASVSLLVGLCVRVRLWVCLPIIPVFAAHQPSLFRGVRERWKTFPFFMGLHVCWPAPVSASRTVVCVLHGSFPSGFFSTRLLLISVAFPVCPGLPTVARRPAGFLAFSPQCMLGRSSSPPPCVSHPLLADLHIARCLSPGPPPRT